MKNQKKIVCLMTFKNYFEHTEPIFQELQILNIYKVNDYLTSLFIIRYFHLQNLPENFTNYILANKEIHNYNTRNSSSLHKKCCRVTYTKHALVNKGTEVWNNLPTQYKNIQTDGTFKKTTKKYFLYLINTNEQFHYTSKMSVNINMYYIYSISCSSYILRL